MDMFCTKCGAQNADDAAFCCKCGVPLKQAAPARNSTAPVQDAGKRQPSPGGKKRPRGLVIGAAVVGIVLLLLIVGGLSGEDTPSEDLPSSPSKNTALPAGDAQAGGNDTPVSTGSDAQNDTQDNVTPDNSDAPNDAQDSAVPSGLVGTPDESGRIVVELTDRGNYDVLVLSDDDWDILTNLQKSVSCVSGGATYYMGTDRLAPNDCDEDRSLIMQIPKHWLYVNGMTPYTQYIGGYDKPEGEYLVYALVNNSSAFLSVITDWSSYVHMQGYYLADFSTDKRESDLTEFVTSDEVSLLLCSDDGLLGTAPFAPGDLVPTYQPINTSTFSEISVQYFMTDSNGQSYCTPEMTWKES